MQTKCQYIFLYGFENEMFEKEIELEMSDEEEEQQQQTITCQNFVSTCQTFSIITDARSS